ncbi:MAG: FtsQ-type POTRA domain-containing protein [Spirochaetaceae bacterium]|nr:MAG: FtsQ-type POTRA domain-containing protein [Spirochaetaceae bacterium]
MADAIFFAGFKKEKVEALLRKALWVLIIGLFLFSAGEMIFHFFIAPQSFLRSIEIKTDLPIAEQEILSLAGLSRNEYYFFIDTARIEENLKTHPLVKDALVEKVFPDGLKLTLVGRSPVCVTFGLDAGRSVPYLVDEEGILFKAGISDKNGILPVLSGISIPENAVGKKVPEALLPLFGDLAKIRMQEKQLLDLVSEIRVISMQNNSFELYIYPVSYHVKVQTGKRLSGAMLRAMFFGLHFMKQEGILPGVQEVDFRTGELVYRTKGGVPSAVQ